MISGTRKRARVFGPLLSALLVALSVAVPVLDRDGASSSVVLESEHHQSCVVGHDHTVCTQVGANPVAGAAPSRDGLPDPVAIRAAVLPTEAPVERFRVRGPRSRAPPVA